jgi:hypothetical protein
MKLLCVLLLVSSSLFALDPQTDLLHGELLFNLLRALDKKGTTAQRRARFDIFNNILDGQGPFSPSPDPLPHVEAVQMPPVVLGSADFPYSAVYPVVAPFYSQFPVPAPNPRLVFLDGLGNTIVAVDMTTLAVVSQVVVPSTVGPFGIRPTPTGSENEVWIANSGLEVSVVDLSSQSLVSNILTPSIPRAVSPAGIVFTADGGTAIEAVKYFSPDSSGNQGALLVFDAVSRTLTSTLLLKFAPTALLMAPDGLTAYLLSDTSTLTYYDVLSGTADLTVSTLTPGSSAGYNPFGQVYIHPDGSRLLWSAGGQLQIFDLTTRTVTKRFSFGLPSTVAAGAAMSMSQDGGRVYVSDVLGDVVILDTQYGNILLTYNTGASTATFGGPPLAP